ncbi:MAG TPA: thioesterase family protein [Bryobacteraceae bacterium]|nr:thioesterase family protein [Bryobacteraceae bacterium]
MSTLMISPGLTGTMQVEVDGSNAVDFLGLPDARVLGTPFMICYMEMTCRDLVKPHLDEGYDTVGTHVDVKHLGATPLGLQVTFQAELLEVNDRRLRFRVEAHDGREKVGEGFHERAIVHVERFASRVKTKHA